MIPKNVQLLINTYKASQLRLIDMIAKAEAKGNVTAYRKAVLQDVNQELGALNDYAKKWMRNEVPIAYGAGADEAFKAYVEANINPVKIYTNKKAIDSIINSATDQLTDASQYVGRRINDLLKEAGAEAIAEKLTSGDTVKQAKNLMLKKMSEKGITAIRDKRGREISLDAYASMVARTTTREATNTGTMNAMQEVGEDLVQMTSHMSACPICQPLEGRVYSISGKDKRYPPLSTAFPNGYNVIHPNCIHSLTPYIEKFDDNAEATRKESNRPFELDPKKKSQLDAYYAEQKVKAQRRADYRLWEKSKTLAPNEAPKTFSGFRAMKRANSERYQQLRMEMDKALLMPKKQDEIIKSLEKKGIIVKSNIFKEVDNVLMEDNIRRIDEITDKYPKITQILKDKPITIDSKYLADNESDVIAKISTKDDGIALVYNKNNFKNREYRIKQEKELQAKNWLTKTAEQNYHVSATNHEMGHVIHEALIEQVKIQDSEYIKLQRIKLSELKKDDMLGSVVQELMLDNYPIDKTTDGILEVASKMTGAKADKSMIESKYGMSSQHEWLAEAFSNSEGGDSNIIGKAMAEYLGGKLK